MINKSTGRKDVETLAALLSGNHNGAKVASWVHDISEAALAAADAWCYECQERLRDRWTLPRVRRGRPLHRGRTVLNAMLSQFAGLKVARFGPQRVRNQPGGSRQEHPYYIVDDDGDKQTLQTGCTMPEFEQWVIDNGRWNEWLDAKMTGCQDTFGWEIIFQKPI